MDRCENIVLQMVMNHVDLFFWQDSAINLLLNSDFYLTIKRLLNFRFLSLITQS